MNDKEKVSKKIDSGEIINMKSQLAYDEDFVCKICDAIFTLAESHWEGRHPNYNGVLAYGMKCPNCERVNVTYWKTQYLVKLEKRLDRLRNQKQMHRARNKYQKEFMRVQKMYGVVNGIV